jgi:starch phosphorylase
MFPLEILPSYVAYFSMEVGLDSSMPTYSGGLGILAGDTLRAAADLGLPMIGVTLLHRKGYFRQTLDAGGNQTESPAGWNYEEVLEPMVPRAFVPIAGRAVMVRLKADRSGKLLGYHGQRRARGLADAER